MAIRHTVNVDITGSIPVPGAKYFKEVVMLDVESKKFCAKWNISENQLINLLGNIQNNNGIQAIVADLSSDFHSASFGANGDATS